MAITRGQHLIGKVLGSCVLESLLGYGGSSAVFLAQQQIPRRKVAVKVFLPRTGMDSQAQHDFYQRFLREAKAASDLEHANILPIYSYGEQDGLPYIVMPYMAGGTLAEYMAKRGPLSLQETQWYLGQLADALDYAHDQGCIHCDVKPANILLDSDGSPMLSDFGIARLTRSENDSVEVKSRDALIGTPDFISPEQALGRPLDGRSDIYSLGITLFFLLTKRLPFRADSAIALALLHVHEPPPSLTSMRADVTESTDEVMKKTLAKNPDDRFQSAGELSAAFTDVVNGKGKQAFTRNRHVHIFCEEEDISSNLHARFIADESQVRAKPLWMRNRHATRMLLIGIACIIIVSTLGFTTRYIASRAQGTSPKPVVTSTSIEKATKSALDRLTSTNSWPVSSTFFYDQQQQSYHIVNKLPVGVALAPYYNHQFQDFRLTITALEVQKSSEGTDYYGVVFRAASDQSHYYLFEIAPSDHAQYLFWRFDSGHWKHIKSGNISSLVTQSGKSNTLTIEARKNTFSFLVNGKVLDAPVTDASALSLKSGQVGLYVENQGTEVAFSRLYIDPLK